MPSQSAPWLATPAGERLRYGGWAWARSEPVGGYHRRQRHDARRLDLHDHQQGTRRDRPGDGRATRPLRLLDDHPRGARLLDLAARPRRPSDRPGAVLSDPHELVRQGLRGVRPPLRRPRHLPERGAADQRSLQRRPAPERLRPLHPDLRQGRVWSPSAPASATTSTSAAARPDRTPAPPTSSPRGCGCRC